MRPLLIYKYSWTNIKRDDEFYEKFERNAADLKDLHEMNEQVQLSQRSRSGSYHSDNFTPRNKRAQGELASYVKDQRKEYSNKKNKDEGDLETTPKKLLPTFGKE